jgi:hypothetical protein
MKPKEQRRQSKADAERERLRKCAEEKERLRTAPIMSIERLSDYRARIAREDHRKQSSN